MVGIETNTWPYTSCEIAVCGAIQGCPFEPGLGVRPKSRMIAFSILVYSILAKACICMRFYISSPNTSDTGADDVARVTTPLAGCRQGA